MEEHNKSFDKLIIKQRENDIEENDVRDILALDYAALKEKGYNLVNQLVGYVMSGDPTYITSFNNARSIIMKVERDELLEELISTYIKTKFE